MAVTKDIAQREINEAWPEGRKDDTGKVPYDLLAPEARGVGQDDRPTKQ